MRQFGLLGFPLTHSFSKKYFTEKFSTENLDAAYDNFAIPSISDFPQLISGHPNLVGMNVTIPYKQAVMPFLDALDEEAAAVGAVNTIKFTKSENGKPFLTGYNTDLIGFRESIRPFVEQLKSRLQQSGDKGTFKLKALILGTGGASKAVCYGLKQLKVETLFVSRSERPGCITYDKLTPDYYTKYQIIVNTTPLGMNPNADTFAPLDYESIGASHLLFDAVYNPELTRFLQIGAERGALIKNGLEMLHLQAEAAWKIWNA
jgi:shikimate dehydrogenase